MNSSTSLITDLRSQLKKFRKNNNLVKNFIYEQVVKDPSIVSITFDGSQTFGEHWSNDLYNFSSGFLSVYGINMHDEIIDESDKILYHIDLPQTKPVESFSDIDPSHIKLIKLLDNMYNSIEKTRKDTLKVIYQKIHNTIIEIQEKSDNFHNKYFMGYQERFNLNLHEVLGFELSPNLYTMIKNHFNLLNIKIGEIYKVDGDYEILL